VRRQCRELAAGDGLQSADLVRIEMVNKTFRCGVPIGIQATEDGILLRHAAIHVAPV
jgi:hypothetical protein